MYNMKFAIVCFINNYVHQQPLLAGENPQLGRM